MVNENSFEMTNVLRNGFPSVLGTGCSREKDHYYCDIIIMTIIQRKAFMFVGQDIQSWIDGLFDVC